jgi:hypothetical protein
MTAGPSPISRSLPDQETQRGVRPGTSEDDWRRCAWDADLRLGAIPIQPHGDVLARGCDTTGQVGQRSVRSDAELSRARNADRERAVHVLHDVLDDANRFAADCQPRHVEGLCQQRAHAGVDDMATGHVSRVGGAIHEQLLAGDERPDGHLRVIPTAW